MGYLRLEVAPVMSAGYMPPLSSGLAQFIAAPKIRGQIEAGLQKELAEGKADPFDSHPSLPERIAALSKAPASVAGDSRPATDLVDNFQLADTGLLSAVNDVGRQLQPVAWDRTLDQVWAPIWQSQVDAQSEALRGLRVRDLTQQLTSGELAGRLKNPPGRSPANAERANLAHALAASALALALRNAGWTFHTLPGEAYCEKNGRRLEPFDLVAQLAAGSLTRENWEGLCDTNDIGSLQLLAEKAVGA
jgi:hypothetical protein